MNVNNWNAFQQQQTQKYNVHGSHKTEMLSIETLELIREAISLRQVKTLQTHASQRE